MSTKRTSPLVEALEPFHVADIARALGINVGSIYKWIKGGGIAEFSFVPPLAKILGLTETEMRKMILRHNEIVGKLHAKKS
jgi:transposase-like protein